MSARKGLRTTALQNVQVASTCGIGDNPPPPNPIDPKPWLAAPLTTFHTTSQDYVHPPFMDPAV